MFRYDNKIDWDWIKDRRDRDVPIEYINNKAPKAWKKLAFGKWILGVLGSQFMKKTA